MSSSGDAAGDSNASTASQISKLSCSPVGSEYSAPTVLIVGGGTSGLLAGLALIAAGCECHVYEAQSGPQPWSASGDAAFLLSEAVGEALAALGAPVVRGSQA
jgi:ribulose 1,5-bisphosphate synthetase/thiazole synthase